MPRFSLKQLLTFTAMLAVASALILVPPKGGNYPVQRITGIAALGGAIGLLWPKNPYLASAIGFFLGFVAAAALCMLGDIYRDELPFWIKLRFYQ
jgi:hypothetical protein